MMYNNGSLEFGRFLHCEFRNPLAAIWAVSWWLMIFSMKILIFSMKILDLLYMKNLNDFLYDFFNDS